MSQVTISGKAVATTILVAILAIASLNCFTIVSVGEEAAVSSFGKVHEGKNLTGFNLVLPWWNVDEYKLQHQTETLDDLEVASQDKFKTNMDLAYTGNFIQDTADKNRKGTGTASKYLETHVEKRIKSCITSAGVSVENSQAFFTKVTQDFLAEETRGCVNSYLETIGGYEITAIQFSDIRLDPVVKRFMIATKERAEQEEQQNSLLQIADLKAQEVTKISAAGLLASADNKLAENNKTDAKLYAAKAEAKGNKELAASVTPELIAYIRAQRWDGVRSHTVLGNSPVINNLSN